MISGKNASGQSRDLGSFAADNGNALVVGPAAYDTLTVEEVAMTGAAVQLDDIDTPVGFTIQAPATNAASVYLGGTAAAQPIEIGPGASIAFGNLANSQAVYALGNVGDAILIIAEN